MYLKCGPYILTYNVSFSPMMSDSDYYFIADVCVYIFEMWILHSCLQCMIEAGPFTAGD